MMKTKKHSRVLSLFLSAVMVLAMLPAMGLKAEAALPVTEQYFNLTLHGTFYFDLSSEIDNVGPINRGMKGSYPYTGVPDPTLHYVPFTYAGTRLTYTLDEKSIGDAYESVRASQKAIERNVFVSEYNISNPSWNELHAKKLIFGKPFGTNYTLRSLSMGTGTQGVNPNLQVLPFYNEWDMFTTNTDRIIKNYQNIYSWGQDTAKQVSSYRAVWGFGAATPFGWFSTDPDTKGELYGFRPALEVLNPTTLGPDGLKAVKLNLNGGKFDSNSSEWGGEVSSLDIVCAGSTFKAPSATGLTRPDGNTYNYMGWNTRADGSGTTYAVGASVPSSVTSLYAQWKEPIIEQFSLPTGQTYYFDLSGEAGNVGTINPQVPDTTLHYVPFTYAGTVNAYSLDNTSIDNVAASENAAVSARSLFVADYNINRGASWNDLHTKNFIFGKNFNTNYKLRSLSAGNKKDGTSWTGLPAANEWDSILTKGGLTNPIKNWDWHHSWGQDTAADTGNRANRGYNNTFGWDAASAGDNEINKGWRPALEVLNVGTLGTDGLKAIELNLKGGHLGTDTNVTSINIVRTGSYTAPDVTNLTPPTGYANTDFKWNTAKDGSGTTYAVGAAVPNSVATLYAQWIPLPPATFNAVYSVAGGTGSLLESSLSKIVTENTAGITAADKADGNKVSLKLTVATKTAVDTVDSEKIEGVRQGDSLQYYDVTVEKTVTPSVGNPTTTVLTSIPKPVQAVIPVPLGIQGKTSYTVYRIHNGVAEKIPNDPTATEFYSVNAGGTSLTLHVRKFSTYAVITGNKALSGIGTLGDATNPKSSSVDVQGKVLDGVHGVYKLDVSWGAMKFDYNAQGMVWDPVTHAYKAGAVAKGWISQCFEGGNNKITVANHSNGDVILSYTAKLDAVLAGATMTVRATNSLAGNLAANILLAKVPTETAAAPTVDTYVWLTGEPTNLAGLNSNSYTKAGVITITATPDMTSGLTPKKTTP